MSGLTLASDVEKVVQKLQSELAAYAELEFRSDARRIDLITLTRRLDVVDSWLAIMLERGAGEEALGLVTQLKRFGAGKTFIMKMPVTGDECGGELYLRGAISIAESAFFLNRHLPDDPDKGLLHDLAQIFGKGHTHMIAADVDDGRSLTFFLTAYLQAGGEGSEQLLLEGALARLGINAESITAVLDLHRVLGSARPGTLFFSWPTSTGPSLAQAKLDYGQVRLGLVAELFDAVGAAEQAENILQWGQEHHLNEANYAGLVVDEHGIDSARAYFTVQPRR